MPIHFTTPDWDSSRGSGSTGRALTILRPDAGSASAIADGLAAVRALLDAAFRAMSELDISDTALISRRGNALSCASGASDDSATPAKETTGAATTPTTTRD